MGVPAHDVQHVDNVVDVVIEVEAAGCERYHACIHPVGDIHVMVRQHVLHRAAQQRRIVARHGRNDKEFRFLAQTACPGSALFKIDEPAERPLPHDPLGDGNPLAADGYFIDTEFRLSITPRHALEHFAPRRDALSGRCMRGWIQRIAIVQPGSVSNGPGRAECGMIEFIEPIIRHRSRKAFGWPLVCTAQ